MARFLAVAYGLTAYVVAIGSIVYFVRFLRDDLAGSPDLAPASVARSVIIDVALVAFFGVQHSVMARQGFKSWWTRLVPPLLERSTYVLASGAALILLVVLWREVPGWAWRVEHPAARFVLSSLFFLGAAVVLWANVAMNHFDLVGLRQAMSFARGMPYEPLPFKEPGLYRYVRHPMMAGALLVLWSIPEMSWGRLLIAAAFSAYILLGIQLEERELLRAHGDEYRRYRARVPMLVPWSVARSSQTPDRPD